ncbi:hypothetical protein ADP71_17410 [Vitreoscilla sp. C1]|uniref:hypothetical protein n=1 Tax=Vitreoscilla sp. (strain C1) TaxID=96942 RepID=UPI00148EBB04|nr:hypothetical protein [Vitreoscilla sp. C1]AUZ05268.2 hypothetical protein ADP71_17410 [Vitreoscilla sp. C1]
MANQITAQFILGQINHWIHTPQNAYLGSNYGIDLYQYLHKPMTHQMADEIIAKMRADVPVLGSVAEDSLNIYSRNDGFDSKIIVIEVQGYALEFDLNHLAIKDTKR